MTNSNTGYLLNNRYRLIDQIGEGGMANVYLGKDTILNRSVAIKVLRGDLSNDEVFVQRFQREALAATALEHPNLVQVYDVGQEQGYHYIVMEYIEGKTLKQLIKQHGPLSVGETIDVMEQLVSAVEHAHSRQVIHRDIKPQNIIVRNDGTVKLTDFGIAIAQNTAQLTQTNSIMGSVHYLAPEIAKGYPATAQSDIYSLGILMFELLSGHVPFAADSAVNIALMHMEDKIPSIRGIVGSDINQAIENIILKATAKNKSNRYQSAHEMLVDLVDCQYRANEAAFEPEDDYIDDEDAKTKIMEKGEFDKLNKKKMSKKKKGLIFGGIAAAILVLALLFFFITSGAGKVNMPNIIDMPKDQAIVILNENKISEEEGYTIDFVEQNDENVVDGNVISTNPAANKAVSKDETITIYISTGKLLKVPDVLEMSESEAKAELQRLNISVGTTTFTETDDTSKHNKVIAVNPNVGTEIDQDTKVRLEVGIPKKIRVISVIGLTYRTALSRLSEIGLIATTSNCTELATVVSQSVDAGTQVESGKKIKLTCDIDEEDPNNPDKPDAKPE